jgi:hypothetical protein
MLYLEQGDTKIARKEQMWDILRNMQVLVGLLASCLSIGAAIVAIAPHSRKLSRGGYSISSSASSDRRKGISSSQKDLDFWEKVESVGKGILEGICNGFIAVALTMIFLCPLLYALFFALELVHIAHFSPTLVWLVFGLAGLVAVIVGLMVGIVSGVNETKRDVRHKRVYISRIR